MDQLVVATALLLASVIGIFARDWVKESRERSREQQREKLDAISQQSEENLRKTVYEMAEGVRLILRLYGDPDKAVRRDHIVSIETRLDALESKIDSFNAHLTRLNGGR